MRIKSKTLSAIFKLAIALIAFVCMTVQAGAFEGRFDLSMFRFFTLQSNLLSALYFLFDAIYILSHSENDGGDPLFPAMKGIQMMGVTVTWLVAHFMLDGFSMGSVMGLSAFGLHYVAPIMTIADWLLFDKKGGIKAYHPIIWTFFPLLYFGYAMIFSNIGSGMGYGGSRYPYPFIDVDALGIGRVLFTVLILVIVFIALGYVFFAADRLLAKLGRVKSKTDANQ